MTLLAVTPIVILCAATLLAGVAAVLGFVPRLPAAVCAYMSMLAASASGVADFSGAQLGFWAAATAIVVIIWIVRRPLTMADERHIQAYIAGGSLAGGIVGLAISTVAAVIISAAAGAFLGMIAFTRTPRGRAAAGHFQAVDTYAAVGLPAIVNYTIIMLILAQLLSQ